MLKGLVHETIKIVHVCQKLHDKIAVILGRKIAFHIEGKELKLINKSSIIFVRPSLIHNATTY